MLRKLENFFGESLYDNSGDHNMRLAGLAYRLIVHLIKLARISIVIDTGLSITLISFNPYWLLFKTGICGVIAYALFSLIL